MPGPDPTILQIYAQQSDCIDYIQERDRHGNANTPNIYGLYDIIVGSRDGEFTRSATGVFDADRAAAARLLTPNRLRRVLEPHIVEALRKYNVDLGGSYDERWYRVVEELSNANEKFKSRGMTLATPTFPSGTSGTGVGRRRTADRFGNTLECTGAEAKTARCVRDQTNGGRKHREVFRFEGVAQARDSLFWAGSGLM